MLLVSDLTACYVFNNFKAFENVVLHNQYLLTLPNEKYAQTHEEKKRWHLIEAILNLLKKSKLQVRNLIEKQVNCKRAWTTKLSPF